MSLGIAKRVALAFGILLFLFFSTSAISFLLTNRIKDDVLAIVGPGSPKQDVVLEFRYRLLESAVQLGARFARSYDGQANELSVIAWLADFDTIVDGFARSAGGALDEARGGAIRDRLMRIRGIGQRAFALDAEGSTAVEKLVGRVGAATALIDGFLPSAGAGADKEVFALRNAAREARLWLADLTVSVRQHARGPEPAHRETLRRAAVVFARLNAVFEGRATGEEARGQLAALERILSEARTAAEKAMNFSERRAAGIKEFETGLGEILRRLEFDIIDPIRVRKITAEAGLAQSTYEVIIYLLVMTGIGGMMGAGTALVLIRGIVRPIMALTEGAEAIGSGQLDFRIDVVGDDELGRLARSFNRMAENRQRSEETLRTVAHQDALTDLPNRKLFQNRLIEAVQLAQRVDRNVAVLLLDLDHFKDVNDTLGHPAGDALLIQVSERLIDCVRRSDTVARLGGDEFAIIQTNLEKVDGIEVLAQRIVERLSKPFNLDGERVYTGCSIGITLFPHDGKDADKLVKNADLALYRAKQEGRNKHQMYDAEMNAEISERKSLERDLRRAIENNDLFLAYQPRVHLESGEVTGVEALVRWQHPVRGLVPPLEFIPVAEQAGLITNLTDLVLRLACRQMRAWREEGSAEIQVSINLSPVDFKSEDFITNVMSVLRSTGVEPRWIEFEITEGLLMSTDGRVSRVLDELQGLGFQLAIDDFGTGYCSMAYLQRFSVDKIKIDQMFIKNLGREKDGTAITKAIIHLAHDLGLSVTAEGVETEDQAAFLREQGCNEGQGHWISRPLDAKSAIAFVSSQTNQLTQAAGD